jgi:hypothetical protein
MKTVIPVLADGTSVIATGSNMGEDDDSKMREVVHICGRCYKTFDHQDDLVNHACMNNISLTQQTAAPLATISSPLATTAGTQSAKKNRSGSSKPGSNETQQGGPFPCQTCGKVSRHS